MRLIKAGMWAAATLAAAAVIGTFGAGNASAANRAFRGSTAGTIAFDSPTHAIVTTSGNATHLGPYTRVEDVTIGAGGSLTGTITFTSHDGDQIFVSFTGGFINANDATGTYTITGGTGKYEGATGTAEFTANTPDFVNVTASWEGTINY